MILKCGDCGWLNPGNVEHHQCPRPVSWPPRPAPIDLSAPSYYLVGGYECRKVAAALGLNHARGDAFAYLWRAGRKPGADEAEDLRKAIECLKFELEQLAKAGQ